MIGRRGALAALLVLACASGAGAEPPVPRGAVRVDGLAALVGGTVPGPGVQMILRSDVTLRARLALAGEAPSGGLPLGPLSAGLLRASLKELIGEALIVREASRVALPPPQPAALRAERARLAVSAGGAGRFNALAKALGVTRTEIDRIVERRALVGAFLEANLQGVTEVTTADVERAYEQGDHPFIGSPLEEVREALRFWLGREAMREAVARWVSGLRSRTTVKVLAEF